MNSKKNVLKEFFQNQSLISCLFLTIIITPWFWFLRPGKIFFNPEFKKDIQEARLTVIWERGETSNTFPTTLFSNWPVVFIRRRLVIVMENLDIGNYFFAGHPRARVGVEEKQKFFFFQFLLLLIGFTNPKIKKYAKYLLGYLAVVLLADFIFKWRGFNETFLFSVPLLLVISLGMEKIFQLPKKWRFIFSSLAGLEIVAFLTIF